ncbi:hypothetical protein QDR37_05430 [Amnibacterium sp. CER49]|uniref:hypothetical protein n=1 Tax=Amnibacterium sp. CER49 TaxID=3039161 RepID=UPI00244A1E3B|nr:hypothetical protein [Amnibacterium sp. CER49]MDH2443382.1 hypothetical protein [Amnibacterium sp. CER49]
MRAVRATEPRHAQGRPGVVAPPVCGCNHHTRHGDADEPAAYVVHARCPSCREEDVLLLCQSSVLTVFSVPVGLASIECIVCGATAPVREFWTAIEAVSEASGGLRTTCRPGRACVGC